MRGRQPKASEAITTKDLRYKAARGDLDRGCQISLKNAAILLGLTEKTLTNWAALGRMGAKKVNREWVFSPYAIRAEIGLKGGTDALEYPDQYPEGDQDDSDNDVPG